MKCFSITLIVFVFVVGCSASPSSTALPSNMGTATPPVITQISTPFSSTATMSPFPTLPPAPRIASTPSPELQGLVESGRKAAADGRYEDALTIFTRVLAADAGITDAYNRRAGVYLELGNFPQALADYNRAIALDSKNASLYSNRAAVALNQEKYLQAIEDYNKAIELDSKASHLLVYRGWAYFKAGDIAKATSDYKRALELDPKSGSAYANRAWFFDKQGKVAQALDEYNQALVIDPNNAVWLSLRAFAAFRLGNTAQATADFKRALELDAESAIVLNNLCWAMNLGFEWQDAAALDLCQKAVEKDPRTGGIRDSRGLARALRGDYPGAIEDFQYFVEWSKRHGEYSEYGKKREQWIGLLQSGKNPFDANVLRALREE